MYENRENRTIKLRLPAPFKGAEIDIDDGRVDLKGKNFKDANDPKEMTTSDIGLDIPKMDPGMMAMVAATVSAVHEAIEWTTVDGKRLMDPHPYDEDNAWAFLVERVTKMLVDYQKEYPA